MQPYTCSSIFLHSYPHLPLASCDLPACPVVIIALAPGEGVTCPYSGWRGSQVEKGGWGTDLSGGRRMETCSKVSTKAWPGSRGVVSCTERASRRGDLILEFVPVVWEARTLHPVGPATCFLLTSGLS